jgi:hypothetical protein
MPIIHKISKSALASEPYLIWNSFVDILAMEDYKKLSGVQQHAHLVFWYENEVQNGGHFQYFENRGVEFLHETIEALAILEAKCQQLVLSDAGRQYLRKNRPNIETVEDFCTTALEGEFSVFDDRFHSCLPSLDDCLHKYLDRHQSAFVIIE